MPFDVVVQYRGPIFSPLLTLCIRRAGRIGAAKAARKIVPIYSLELKRQAPVRTRRLRQSIRVRVDGSTVYATATFYGNPADARAKFTEKALARVLPLARELLVAHVRAEISKCLEE